MKTVPLRRIALINPGTPEFDVLPDDALVTFMPLEAVWSDGRLDTSRRALKSTVATGYTRFRSGDVVVPKVSPTFEAGRSVVMNIEGVGAGTTELHVLRATADSDPRFLGYVARSKHFLEEGETAYEGVAGLRRVSSEFVADFRIPLTRLDEQRRIADFLDDQVSRIDQVVMARRRQSELLREWATTALAGVVLGADVGGPRRRASWPAFGEVPEAWRETRLRSIECLVQTGPFGSQLHADEYVEAGWPVVNPAGISPRGLMKVPGMSIDDATRERLRRHTLLLGDVVFGRRGELGRAGLVTEHHVGWVCGTGSLRLRVRDDRLRPEYLVQLLRTPALRHYFARASVGSTMSNLNTGILLAMPLLLPTADDQHRILLRCGEIEESVDRRDAELAGSIALLDEYKHSIVAAAVTGEFDVGTAGWRSSSV